MGITREMLRARVAEILGATNDKAYDRALAQQRKDVMALSLAEANQKANVEAGARQFAAQQAAAAAQQAAAKAAADAARPPAPVASADPYYGPSADPSTGIYTPPMPALLNPYAPPTVANTPYAPQYMPPTPVAASGFTTTHALMGLGALFALSAVIMLARRK